MDNCLFCKIIKGEIPSKKVYEDKKVYAFEDISPAAKHHILVIPKEHIESANDLIGDKADVVSDIFRAVSFIAKELKFDETGYRVVNNCGEHGAQTVKHLHFHVLGGEAMGWPPFPLK